MKILKCNQLIKQILIVISIVILFSILIPSATSQVIPTVEAINGLDLLVVDVQNNRLNETVTYHGYIECDTVEQTNLTVNLTAEPEKWNVTIEPLSMYFEKGGVTRQDYTVTLSVPVGTNINETRNSVVGGDWRSAQGLVGTVREAKLIIVVEQYFRFNIIADFSSKIRPNDRSNITVIINNTGNGNDQFRIQISNKERLELKGWKIESPKNLSLNVSENTTVCMNITAPGNAGKYALNLSVISIISEIDQNATVVSVSEIITITIPGEDDSLTEVIKNPIFWVVILCCILGVAIYRFKMKT